MEPVYATHLHIKKSVLFITLSCREDLEGRKAYLIRREENPAIKEKKVLSFQCKNKTRNILQAKLDLSSVERGHADWSVMLSGGADGESAEELRPVILSGRVRMSLILGNYEYKREKEILFPMGSGNRRLIVRCRPLTCYDGKNTRMKEFLAYGLYRISRPVWRKKRIWVMFEKYCASAQDNGFVFFRYCMENPDVKERKRIFYILDRNSPQWAETEKYRENIIPFMSFRHIFYMLAASLYVASDSRIHGYLWQPKPNLISREINRHKIFFLQHGVLGLKRVEDLFGRNGVCPVTYFTTSSKLEQDIVVKEFGYAPENAPVVGLARWDVLENRALAARPKILIMPTWRSWLEYLDDEEFCKSEYYRRYTSLISNQELLSFLKQRGTELIFYIHPKLGKFMKDFYTDSSLVKLISFGEEPLNRLLMECSMLITDYSSVCWDVYYLEKPVLFYQFDSELYNKTNGSYLDMEKELFGDRCTDEAEIITAIKEYVCGGFVEKKAFAAMRDRYFACRDHNNCRRTYEYIVGRNL